MKSFTFLINMVDSSISLLSVEVIVPILVVSEVQLDAYQLDDYLTLANVDEVLKSVTEAHKSHEDQEEEAKVAEKKVEEVL